MFYLLDIPAFFNYSLEAYSIILVIAIPTFLFWRWLLKKFIKDRSRRIIFAWFFTILLSPVIYSGLIVLFIIYLTHEPSRDFDTVKWLSDRKNRYEMADDLVARKLLIDQDSILVKNIIGEPSWRDPARAYWSYDMGMGGGGLGFMFHDLRIQFKNDKVISVLHRRVQD